MGKDKLMCVICKGIIFHNKATQMFKCSKCDAEYASAIFSSDYSKKGKKQIYMPKLKILFAIIGALYLLYLVYRVFSY